MKDIVLALPDDAEAEDLTQRIDVEGLSCEHTLGEVDLMKALRNEQFRVAVVDTAIARDLNILLKTVRTRRPDTIIVLVARKATELDVEADLAELVLFRPIVAESATELLCGLVKVASREAH